MKQHLMRFAGVAALAAGMAFAQTPAPAPQPGQAGQAGGGMHRRGAMRLRMMQALNLTDAQKQQAKTIFQQTRQTAQPIMQQLKTNRQALSAAIKANDQGQIQSLANQSGTLRGQATALRAESQAKFYGILTADQRAKLDQIHQQRQQRMQQRFGKAQTNG